MFDRFTERARQAVVHAQEEARELGAPAIRTEHLLLGLLRVEEGLAARVLHDLGVTVDDVRAELGDRPSEAPRVAAEMIPFSPQAKRVLELALREALAIGHKYIGTEHLLLGIVRDGAGEAARILAARGADAEAVRDQVVAKLSRPSVGRRRPLAFPGRFEYRVELLDELSAERLNELGAEGWQVATVVAEEGGYRTVFCRIRR